MRVFTQTYKEFSKRVRSLLPMVIGIGLFCYFSFNFSGGEYGLEARDRLGLHVSDLKTSLNQVTHEREFYEHRISLIQSATVSEDLTDELARKTLQYAAPDEMVLFE